MSNEPRKTLFSLETLRFFLVDKLAMNKAVLYILITRCWQFISAPITLYLIYKFFGERLQGYYYLFPSLLGAQLFFELGLHAILAILASHEWALLRLDKNGDVVGDAESKSRLWSIVRHGDRWFRLAALLFGICLLACGPFFIHDVEDSVNLWLGPWVFAVVVNSISLAYQPRISILEGCNQVKTINFFRMIQAILGSLVVWTAIASGASLWTIGAANAARLIFEVYLVEVRFRGMFQSLKKQGQSNEFKWKQEIWPLHWKLALQSIGLYFTGFFFVPVIDAYHGKIASGRMGMTWSIMATLQAASLAWTQTRMPEFGSLTAQARLKELNRRMKRIGAISISLYFVAGTLFASAVWILSLVKPDAANRFLEPFSIFVLVIGMSISQISWHQQSYVRLFKRDPFLIMNSINSLLTGFTAWYFGQHYGAIGIIVSYLCVNSLFVLPMCSWLMSKHIADFPETDN